VQDKEKGRCIIIKEVLQQLKKRESVHLKGKNKAKKFFAAEQVKRVLLNNTKQYCSNLMKRNQ